MEEIHSTTLQEDLNWEDAYNAALDFTVGLRNSVYAYSQDTVIELFNDLVAKFHKYIESTTTPSNP